MRLFDTETFDTTRAVGGSWQGVIPDLSYPSHTMPSEQQELINDPSAKYRFDWKYFWIYVYFTNRDVGAEEFQGTREMFQPRVVDFRFADQGIS